MQVMSDGAAGMISNGAAGEKRYRKILADDGDFVEEEWPLSNDATRTAGAAVGVDGCGRLGGGLGLGVGGEEGEEGIH
jgi:hypothetical protein